MDFNSKVKLETRVCACTHLCEMGDDGCGFVSSYGLDLCMCEYMHMHASMECVGKGGVSREEVVRAYILRARNVHAMHSITHVPALLEMSLLVLFGCVGTSIQVHYFRGFPSGHTRGKLHHTGQRGGYRTPTNFTLPSLGLIL